MARYTRLATEGLDISFEGFEAIGLDVTMPPDVNLLDRLATLVPQAAAEGLELRRPAAMPPTGLAHVLLAHGEATRWAAPLRLSLYHAYWTEGADIADPAVLGDLAVDVGLAAQEVHAVLGDRVALAARRRQMAAHRRDGVGGVPVVLASRTLIPALMDDEKVRALAAAI